MNNRLKFNNTVGAINKSDIEIQTVMLTGNSNNDRCKEINLVAVYRPPSGINKRGKEQLIAFCDPLPGS